MNDMQPDAIAVMAVGVTEANYRRQIEHLTTLLRSNGYKVVAYGSSAWASVILDVADRLEAPALDDPFAGDPELSDAEHDALVATIEAAQTDDPTPEEDPT